MAHVHIIPEAVSTTSYVYPFIVIVFLLLGNLLGIVTALCYLVASSQPMNRQTCKWCSGHSQAVPVFEVVAELSGCLNYPLVLPLTCAVDSGKFPVVWSFHFIEMKESALQEGLNKITVIYVLCKG